MKAPLAERMRPASIEHIVGQRHLLSEGKALYNIIQSGELPNLIFYGPSGVGKTTLASIIAKSSGRKFHKLNGTSASTADIKAIVGELDPFAAPNGILLYLDEIQYFNKKQQQTLLDYIENGEITLIASTTENPYFYIHNAILSRSTVFEFKSVTPEDIIPAVERAFSFMAEEKNACVELEEGVARHIAYACGGDVRKAMNSVELSVLSTLKEENRYFITLEKAKELTQKSSMKYDRDGDEHYDILSAFQKSMRGSGVDASLHYLARLLEAGDLPSATRRLMVCAAEDVGLAYPQILPIVKACVDMALMVGLPEARIPLGDAVILVATSPKSNTGHVALDKAISDIRQGKIGPVPRQLQNMHYDGEDNGNKGQFYLYPHDYPGSYVKQQYLPDILKDAVYYVPGNNKTEQSFKAYMDRIKDIK